MAQYNSFGSKGLIHLCPTYTICLEQLKDIEDCLLGADIFQLQPHTFTIEYMAMDWFECGGLSVIKKCKENNTGMYIRCEATGKSGIIRYLDTKEQAEETINNISKKENKTNE